MEVFVIEIGDSFNGFITEAVCISYERALQEVEEIISEKDKEIDTVNSYLEKEPFEFIPRPYFEESKTEKDVWESEGEIIRIIPFIILE